MKTIYLDSDFKCHIAGDSNMTSVETDVFDGKCDAFIEGYRFVPAGATWTRQDGTIFTGEMVGLAIEAAKMGKKIARAGWNGKNQYVELASCISYKNSAGEIVNVDHDAIGNKALAFVGTSGVQMGWLASQADMLADDWKIVE